MYIKVKLTLQAKQGGVVEPQRARPMQFDNELVTGRWSPSQILVIDQVELLNAGVGRRGLAA
jgi:hypothetical protein